MGLGGGGGSADFSFGGGREDFSEFRCFHRKKKKPKAFLNPAKLNSLVILTPSIPSSCACSCHVMLYVRFFPHQFDVQPLSADTCNGWFRSELKRHTKRRGSGLHEQQRIFITKIHTNLVSQACISFLRCFRTVYPVLSLNGHKLCKLASRSDLVLISDHSLDFSGWQFPISLYNLVLKSFRQVAQLFLLECVDEGQITHLICARLKYDLYDFFRGCFGPASCSFSCRKGPKTPPKKVI